MEKQTQSESVGAMYISHGRKYLTHENISPLPRSALNLFVNKGVINERPKNKLKVTRVNSGKSLFCFI